MGVKVGLEHVSRFQYGVGYTFLASPVEQLRTVNGVAATPVRLRLGYVTPYVEYAFYQRGPWEVRILYSSVWAVVHSFMMMRRARSNS